MAAQTSRLSACTAALATSGAAALILGADGMVSYKAPRHHCLHAERGGANIYTCLCLAMPAVVTQGAPPTPGLGTIWRHLLLRAMPCCWGGPPFKHIMLSTGPACATRALQHAENGGTEKAGEIGGAEQRNQQTPCPTAKSGGKAEMRSRGLTNATTLSGCDLLQGCRKERKTKRYALRRGLKTPSQGSGL